MMVVARQAYSPASWNMAAKIRRSPVGSCGERGIMDVMKLPFCSHWYVGSMFRTIRQKNSWLPPRVTFAMRGYTLTLHKYRPVTTPVVALMANCCTAQADSKWTITFDVVERLGDPPSEASTVNCVIFPAI